MGILSVIKNTFKSMEDRNDEWVKDANKTITKEDYNEEIKEYLDGKSFHVVHVNPNVYLAQRGARICIGKDSMNDTYANQAKYVSKVLTRGHESVSEHANVIGILKISKPRITQYINDYTEMLSNMHFCHFVTRDTKDMQYILFSGSPRAFIHCIRESQYDNYFIKEYLKPFLYSTFEKELMVPLIDIGYMNADQFQYLPDGDVYEVEDKVTQVKNSKEETNVDNTALECDSVYEPEEYEDEHVTLVYKSPITKIYNKVKDYGFSITDVYKVATVSFIFHNVSRTCSHQLVRHRVGISQESQRYVTHDYDKKNDFVNPIKMNYAERYTDSKFNSVIKSIDETNPFRNYAYLISNGIFKEDARAWLPGNVITKVMMTFTYWQYARFLYFRLDKAAQKEIRDYCADESSNFLFDNPTDRQKFIDLCSTYDKIERKDREEDLVSSLKDEDIDEEISEDEIQNLEINSEEDAKKLIERSEELNKLDKN